MARHPEPIDEPDGVPAPWWEREEAMPRGSEDERYQRPCSMCGKPLSAVAECAICGDALDAYEAA